MKTKKSKIKIKVSEIDESKLGSGQSALQGLKSESDAKIESSKPQENQMNK